MGLELSSLSILCMERPSGGPLSCQPRHPGRRIRLEDAENRLRATLRKLWVFRGRWYGDVEFRD